MALRQRPRAPWATRMLTAGMLAVAATIAIAVGDSTDVGVLVRAGRDGPRPRRRRRVVAAVQLHLHPRRRAAPAGQRDRAVVPRPASPRSCSARRARSRCSRSRASPAAVASYLASPAGISAGASGAMFGLLGAVFVELTLHRPALPRGVEARHVGRARGRRDRRAGRHRLQMYPGVIDQWAHGGGVLIGAVIGALLSPHARVVTSSRPRSARVIVVAFAIVCAITVVMVVRTLDRRQPRSRRTARSRSATGVVAIRRRPAGRSPMRGPSRCSMILTGSSTIRFAESDAAQPFDDLHGARAGARAQAVRPDRHRDRARRPAASGVAGPASSRSRSIEPDAVGGRQRYRLIVAGKPMQGRVVLLSIEVSDWMARAAPGFFSAVIASVAVAITCPRRDRAYAGRVRGTFSVAAGLAITAGAVVATARDRPRSAIASRSSTRATSPTSTRRGRASRSGSR